MFEYINLDELVSYSLFVIGLIVYLQRPKFAPFYYLAWNSLFAYIIDIIINLNFSVNNLFESMSVNYIWLCAFLFVVRKNKFATGKMFIVLSFFFLIYIVWLGYSRSCLQPFQGWLRGYFCFLPLWMIVENSSYSIGKYSKFIFFMMILQLLLACFQHEGFLYPSYAGKIAENGAVNILGTYRRYNDFACAMSLLILSYFSMLLSSGKKLGIKELMLILISVFFVYRSGARTEMLCLAVSLFFLLWTSKSEIRIKKIVWPLSLFFAFFFLSALVSTIDINDENTGRQQELVEIWNGERSLSEKTTLFLSVIILEDYFSSPQNLLTGSGKLYKEGYGGWVSSKSTMWDSDLALFLAETGLIGILFYVLFLCRILKDCKNKKYSITIMLFLILTSITDYGMFEGKSAIYFLFMVYFSKQKILTGENKDAV